jgi:Lrp/AsnC family transcriptional regulator, leucine-responsive regulatory protein
MEFSFTKLISMNEIDATDARLLDLLQQDASLSNQDLAQAAHVSPATALRRIKRLAEAGVIERQTALLSLAATRGMNAIVEITLDRQGDEHAKAFEAHAIQDDAVQQCYRVTAGPDFVMVLWVVDMPAYQAVVERLFTQHANVRSVKTFFATSRAKFNPAVPATAMVMARE